MHVGQQVVCIDDDNQHDDPTHKDVLCGCVYTIRWIGPDKCRYTKVINLCVRLIGIDRSSLDGVDTPFRATRFRPVKETSIDVFLRMLEPVNA